MIPVWFDKALAESFIDAVQTGKPIHCEWSGRNMLTLAGVMFATVFSQGPALYQMPGMPKVNDLHNERQEAIEEDLTADIHAAIEFLSHVTFKVIDGEYDEEFEPQMSALLIRKEDGGGTVRPVKGWKNLPNIME